MNQVSYQDCTSCESEATHRALAVDDAVLSLNAGFCNFISLNIGRGAWGTLILDPKTEDKVDSLI
jgi:hypothetical protein